MLASAAIPVGPGAAVVMAGIFLATYLALALRSLGVDSPVPVVIVLVTAGTVVAWLGLAGSTSSRTEPARRTERLARQALPFLALLPAGVLAPEFAFGQPGPGRIALVLATCLLLFLILRFHVAGQTASVTAWIERRAGLLLVALVAVHVVVTTALVIVRHHYHNAILGEDTAYYNQIFWSTIHGDFFRGSLTQARYWNPPVHSEFGAHSSPVLFLLLPAYWAHPSFYTLLALRNLALSASALPLYCLTKMRLGAAVAVGVVVFHLLGPNLLHQSVGAFYPMQFAMLFIPLTFLAFDRGRFASFMAAFVLALSVREEIALTAALFSVWALLWRRSWRWVVTPAAVALAWWYVCTRFIIVPSRIAMEDLEPFFQAFPEGYRGAAITLLRHPVEFLDRILTAETVAYLYGLLKATSGLALATPAILFAVPTALINVTVGAFWKTTTLITMHYSVAVSVCLSVALVYGLAQLARLHGLFRTSERAVALALVLLLTPQVLLGVKDVVAYGGRGAQTLVDEFRPRPYDGTLRLILRTLDGDPEAAVAAPSNLLPQLSTRRELYHTTRLWWYRNPRLDYIVIDSNVRRVEQSDRHRARHEAVFTAVGANPSNRLMLDLDGFRLYRVERGSDTFVSTHVAPLRQSLTHKTTNGYGP
jgi:uncharacterized membrane protein